MVDSFIKQLVPIIENITMGMSLPERLIVGISLGLLGLVSLYVLVFKSAIARIFPRVLVKLVLLAVVISASMLSYFIITTDLVHPVNEGENSLVEPYPSSQSGKKSDSIEQIQKRREEDIRKGIGD